MKELAIFLRMMQLYTHNAHNLVEKSLFFQDHDHLGGLYSTYEDAYDGVIERIIGLADSSVINLVEIQVAATTLLKSLPAKEVENSAYFQKINEMEIKLRAHIAQIYPQSSIGTQQMIGDLADKSEQRSYKLKQRVKK
jgi:DNA-binding ferritin-like protein